MERNTELSAAREAMPSPRFGGEPMSRAELAEAANAELWRTVGQHFSLDAHTIARYERGQVRWPGLAYRSAFRAVLGVSTDAELGFFPTRRRSSNRRSSSADLLDGLAVSSPRPTRVGWADVEHVRATTRSIAMSENLFGGGPACAAAAVQLRWTTGLLSASARDDVRAALFEAVGNQAGVVAFAAFDVGDHGAADRCFRFALHRAEEAGSWALRSNTLADMARSAEHAGQVDEALSLVELAQVRSDRVTPTARAMTSMLRGRCLAAAGRVREAQDELVRADEWMAGSDPALDPPWLCYYDVAEHQGSTGRALGVIARHTGNPEPAVRRLTDAVERAGHQYPRSRTFSRVRLAALLMVSGDVNSAVTIGHAAMHDARAFRSHRVDAELREFARVCRVHGRTDSAVELSAEIDGNSD